MALFAIIAALALCAAALGFGLAAARHELPANMLMLALPVIIALVCVVALIYVLGHVGGDYPFILTIIAASVFAGNAYALWRASRHKS